MEDPKNAVAASISRAQRELVDALKPLEKAALYDDGNPPDRLNLAQAKELKKHTADVYGESDSYPNYEGRSGASARRRRRPAGVLPTSSPPRRR